jgi:hypothetical protein
MDDTFCNPEYDFPSRVRVFFYNKNLF